MTYENCDNEEIFSQNNRNYGHYEPVGPNRDPVVALWTVIVVSRMRAISSFDSVDRKLGGRDWTFEAATWLAEDCV